MTDFRSRIVSRGPLILASLALGCAAMVRGTHQNVPFSSSPPGAVVQSESTSCETPCALNLSRGQSHVLTVRKPGYQDGRIQLSSELNSGWLLADILSWFPFNFFFMDADYDLTPTAVDVTLQPVESSALSPGLTPVVMELRVTRSASGYASVEVHERRAN